MSIKKNDVQEAGRGGRDGSIAKAILIWSLEDSLNYSVYEAGSREAAMREFAETKDCRRQVLLDALGAEKAVCSGCDLCNIKQNPPKKKRLADWEYAFKILKKSRNFYSEDEIEEELYDRLNKTYRKALGVNVWTHRDTVEVVKHLKDSGKVEEDNFLWKGRLRVCKNKKALSQKSG